MAARALIVDDNEVARFLIRNFLETLGYEVVAEADTQIAAMDAYGAHKPDVVILDLALEFDDGMTILRELRKVNASVKVIIVSGNSQKAMVQELMQEGAAGFLAKPFDLQGFKQVVEQALR